MNDQTRNYLTFSCSPLSTIALIFIDNFHNQISTMAKRKELILSI